MTTQCFFGVLESLELLHLSSHIIELLVALKRAVELAAMNFELKQLKRVYNGTAIQLTIMPPKAIGKAVKKAGEAQKNIAKGDKKKKRRRKESYAIYIY